MIDQNVIKFPEKQSRALSEHDIRAKDEAEATLKRVSTALKQMGLAQDGVSDSAGRTAVDIERLQRQFANLERYNREIAATVETATAAMSRQSQTLLSTNAAITDRKNRIAELTRALGILSREADNAFTGPRRNGLNDQIRSVQSQLKAANSDLGRLSTTFNRELSTLQSSREAFRGIQAAQREVESSITSASAEIAAQTVALDANTAAARRAQAAQQFFNNKGAPGLDRNPRSPGEREEIAGVLRVAEARDIEIQKLHQLEQATRNLAETQRVAGNVKGAQATIKTADAVAVERYGVEMSQAAAATEEEAAAIHRLRNQLNPLVAVEAKLAAETQRLAEWQRQGKISAQEFGQATALLRRNADGVARSLGATNSRGQTPLFGLRPHELQNLSFQLNDVLTQLASGTSLTQTLAQQGGQIVQLFPRVGAAIAAGLTSAPVIALTAGLAVLVLGLKEAADEAAQLRGFEGVLTASADGAAYQAKALREATRELDRYGLSAKEAITAVRQFQREGIDQTRIVEFSTAAKNLADVMEVDLKQATQEVADGFTGGFEAVKKLDDAYGFLTASQREQIRLLFEEGRAGDARVRALDTFSGKMQQAADKARSEWAEAFRSLGQAWETFTHALGRSEAIQAIGGWLDDAAKKARLLILELSGASNAAEALLLIEQRAKQIAEAEREISTNGDPFGFKKWALGKAREDLARLQAQLKAFQAQVKQSSADTLANQQERQRKADEELRRRAADLANQQLPATARVRAAETSARAEAERSLGEDTLKFASDAAKQDFIRQRIAEARRKIEKEITAERERQQREFAQAIGNNGRERLVDTAKRFAGFSENNQAQRGSLMDFFKQNGVNVDPKMVAWCAAFVNAVLASNGLPGTKAPNGAAALNARSFLNFGQDATNNPEQGDVVVLRRGRNQAEGHVGFFQGFDQRGNVRVLGGNQGRDGSVSTQAFNRRDVLGIRRAPSLGQVATEQAREDDQRLERQRQLNEAIDRQLETRRDDTRQLKEQAGLVGADLIASQRKAAIEDAVRKARQEAAKAGIEENDPALQKRLQLIRETEAAYFDMARARDVAEAQRSAVEQPVQDLAARRDEIQRQIEFFQQNGQGGLAAQLEPQLEAVNLRLDDAITKLAKFYDTIISQGPAAAAQFGMTVDQVENLRLGLETLSSKSVNLGTQFLMTGRQINESMAGQAASGFDQFAQHVAAGDNVFASLRDAFLGFAADFLGQIAQMIIQQAVFNALGGAKGSGGGGFGGLFGGFLGSLFHDGGVVGGDGEPRAIEPSWFRNAKRLHTGGIAGLRSNEVPAILERGEEVLTRSDPRHAFNGGGAGGGTRGDIKIVNAIDAGDLASQIFSTKTGESALMNVIRANRGAVKQALG